MTDDQRGGLKKMKNEQQMDYSGIGNRYSGTANEKLCGVVIQYGENG